MKFLDKIVDQIIEDKINLSDLTIVLPSERAKKYLSAALYKAHKHPIISPEITTMDKWIKSHTPLPIIDKTRALIQLFDIQQENIESAEDTSFDEFLNWGNLLLSDFNEIDRYLLDAKSVFRNLADIKEIENWSFNSTELTESQKRFMAFWDRLPIYYEKLKKRFEEKNIYQSGQAYKYLTENIDILFKTNKKQRFIFAGFNALSIAEKSLMRQLHKMGRAEIFIDGDSYYIDNPLHEAGRFIRDLYEYFDSKNFNFISSEIANKPLNVDVIE